MITINIDYDKELSNFAKIYTGNTKYSSHHKILIFEQEILHDIYLWADVVSDIKIKAFLLYSKPGTILQLCKH